MGETLQAISGWLGSYGYPILFLIVFAENAGLPVPGETAVLVSGLLAGQPDAKLSIFWVIPIAFVAAVLGDNLGFWLGREFARRRLEQGKRFLFLTPATLRSVEGYFDHYGVLTIFFARFVTGLRVVCALAAGTSRIPWTQFLLANAAGAAAWATAMALLGFFFGQSWDLLHKWLGRGALLMLACFVLLVGLPYLWRHLRRIPSASWDRLLRSQVWHGALAALLIVLCVSLLLFLAKRHVEPRGEEVDQTVNEWLASWPPAWGSPVATTGSYLGSLPVLGLVTVFGVLGLCYAGRPWRQSAALVWALAASEGVGLLVLALLRHKGLEAARTWTWPFGFAGLEAIRATAVYGMLGHLLARQLPRVHAWLTGGVVLLLILLVGFAVVWSQTQFLSEVLVEYAMGSLVLFLGLWGMEGYGLGPPPGPVTLPAEPAGTAAPERVPRTDPVRKPHG